MTIQERLARHQARSKIYWAYREQGLSNIEAENRIAEPMKKDRNREIANHRLRQAGFTPTDAENFIAERIHWL